MSTSTGDEPVLFSAADYAVFGGLLLVSAVIGIFYAWKDRNEKDAETYLIGKRQMSPIPVAISLCVSYVSGVMMVGLPTQVYFYGIIIASYALVYLIGPWITSVYYIPLYFRLNIISVYEILEMRYGKYSRICASMSVVFLMLVFMGIVTYIPCLALSAVSEVSVPLSIVLTCAVCTFYTTLGGIKAVIWTDVVQAGVMIFGMLSVIFKTTSHMGGFSNVTEALSRGDRLNYIDLSLDPRIKNSTWSILLGTPVAWTMMSAVNQPMVQRYLSCKNEKQAKVAAWIFLIPQQLFFWLAILTGVVMYAYFETCDPLISGAIKFPDQALPYMVVNLFKDMPGLSGVFVAAIYSGTLSTISSGINALSAVILEDYILEFRPRLKPKSLTISKLLAFLLGTIVLCMTFIVVAMGKMVIDIFFTAFGSIGGPLMAVYTMAVFLPWTNEKGAVSGQLLGTAFAFWLSVGQAIYPVPMKYNNLKPLNMSGCPALELNVPTHQTTVIVTEESQVIKSFNGFYSGNDMATTTATSIKHLYQAPYRPPLADTLYAVSPNYLGLFGFLICLIVGIIVSGLTGFENPEYANTDIFVPFIDNKILPAKVIKFFRYGVPVRQRVKSEDNASEIDSIRKTETDL